MSDAKLEQIKARLKAATPGPWGFHTSYPAMEPTLEIISKPKQTSICDMVYGTEYDRDLIANAPTDLAYLLKCLSSAQELVAAANKYLDGEITTKVFESYIRDYEQATGGE